MGCVVVGRVLEGGVGREGLKNKTKNKKTTTAIGVCGVRGLSRRVRPVLACARAGAYLLHDM